MPFYWADGTLARSETRTSDLWQQRVELWNVLPYSVHNNSSSAFLGLDFPTEISSDANTDHHCHIVSVLISTTADIFGRVITIRVRAASPQGAGEEMPRLRFLIYTTEF